MKSEVLQRRVEEIRSRAAIRSWELRQIRHAGGVWFRLERLLARTELAFAITLEQAGELRTQGFAPHPIGSELEPPRSIFVIPRDAVPDLEGMEPIRLQDRQQILLAAALILVPFDGLEPT